MTTTVDVNVDCTSELLLAGARAVADVSADTGEEGIPWDDSADVNVGSCVAICD